MKDARQLQPIVAAEDRDRGEPSRSSATRPLPPGCRAKTFRIGLARIWQAIKTMPGGSYCPSGLLLPPPPPPARQRRHPGGNDGAERTATAEWEAGAEQFQSNQQTKTNMRTVTDHKLNGLNDALSITVLDEPGQGGACHEYAISFGDADDRTGHSQRTTRISFQNGPIQEAGVNGISGEALLAVVIDRLRSFQAGPYSCRENALALTALEESLMWLQKRTRDRLARGVEGTNAK